MRGDRHGEHGVPYHGHDDDLASDRGGNVRGGDPSRHPGSDLGRHTGGRDHRRRLGSRYRRSEPGGHLGGKHRGGDLGGEELGRDLEGVSAGM
ncbi:hypothetical protein [Actinophytocola oryzae]|uniref:hypothetical protein n=1 Tax=Actinophytocola oryzae TaxID=502181 RepID=UPI001063E8F2|nr:hypothetical protein [Actinophytocola oryzae]